MAIERATEVTIHSVKLFLSYFLSSESNSCDGWWVSESYEWRGQGGGKVISPRKNNPSKISLTSHFSWSIVNHSFLSPENDCFFLPRRLSRGSGESPGTLIFREPITSKLHSLTLLTATDLANVAQGQCSRAKGFACFSETNNRAWHREMMAKLPLTNQKQ